MRIVDGVEYQTAADLGVIPFPSQHHSPPPRPTMLTAFELGGMTFPAIKWVVPGYLPEGCTILAGRPKLGKSWLALDIALAVARGTYCLGEVKCTQGAVLYLALEDNLRRLKSRVEKVTPPASHEPWPKEISFATEWPRCENGGLEKIKAWLKAANNPRLVIVDVLAQFRSGRIDNETLYEADYQSLKALQELASAFNIGVLVIHHVRKGSGDIDPFERVSGTMGLTGAADTALILDRSGEGCSLYGRGRDIEEFEKAVTFNKENCRWSVQGDAMEVRRTDERSQILETLRDSGDAMSPTDIAAMTGMKNANVRKLLGKLVKAGDVTKAKYGRYSCDPLPPGHTGNSGHSGDGDHSDV